MKLVSLSDLTFQGKKVSSRELLAFSAVLFIVLTVGLLVSLYSANALLGLGLVILTLIGFFYPEVGLMVLVAGFLLASGLFYQSYIASANKFLGAVVFVGWLAQTLVVKRKAQFELATKQNLALFGLGAVILLSIIVGAKTEFTLLASVAYLSGFVLYFLTVNLVSSAKVLTNLVWAGILSGTVVSIIGIYQILSGQFERSLGTRGDPNYFASYLVVLIPLALSFLWSERSGVKKMILTIGVFLLVICSVLTFSRGALIALAGGLLWLVLKRRDKALTTIVVISLALTIIVPSLFIFPRLSEALFEREKYGGVSVSKRSGTLEAGIAMLVDNPVFGVGVGNFRYYYLKYAQPGTYRSEQLEAHNTFLEVGAELGLIGLAFFVWLIWLTFSSLREAQALLKRRKGSELLFSLSQGAEASLVVMVVVSLFLSLENHNYLWLLIGLGVVFSRLARALKVNS